MQHSRIECRVLPASKKRKTDEKMDSEDIKKEEPSKSDTDLVQLVQLSESGVVLKLGSHTS